MYSLLYIFIFPLFHLSLCDQHKEVGANGAVSPVVVLSVESFRWDFSERIRQLQNESQRPSRLWELIEGGTYAPDGINGTFFTTSIPNQYSMVTGLFQENHGVIAENIYDNESSRMIDFKLPGQYNESIVGGEPIWKTMENGKELIGCFAWFGCDEGNAKYSVPINQIADWKILGDDIVRWLQEGLKLILVSLPDVDIVGRLAGPDADVMGDALKKFDDVIGHLVAKIKEEVSGDVNVIIVGSHGITSARENTPILPPDISNFVRVWTKTQTMWLVEPKEYSENETISYLRQFPNVDVYAKESIPDEWHYKKSRYVAPVMVLAHPGYSLFDASHKGLYGYDNSVTDMRGSFVGYGPAFAPNSIISGPLITTDIYPLLCMLLNIKPAPNNGTIEHFGSVLSPDYKTRLSQWKGEEKSHSYTVVIILSVILVVGIIAGALLCIRSGECKRGGDGDQPRLGLSTAASITADPRLIGKYDSELVLLELGEKK